MDVYELSLKSKITRVKVRFYVMCTQIDFRTSIDNFY